MLIYFTVIEAIVLKVATSLVWNVVAVEERSSSVQYEGNWPLPSWGTSGKIQKSKKEHSKRTPINAIYSTVY